MIKIQVVADIMKIQVVYNIIKMHMLLASAVIYNYEKNKNKTKYVGNY